MKLNKYLISITALCVAMVFSAGCNAAGPTQPPTPFPDSAYTQAAETVIARLTQNAPTVTPTSTQPSETPTLVPTYAPLPTNSPIPTQALLPTATPIPTQFPTPDAASVLYFEDFETDTGWVQESNDRWAMGYADGGYFIQVNISNAPVWSVRNQDLADVQLETDAARTDGPVTGYYGLVCRHLNGDNYYTLVIGSDGFYGIAIKYKGAKLRFLVEGRDENGIILSGSETNRIRADCVGSSLVLFANGQKLAEVQDATLESGDTGLLAGTLKETGLRVQYDNFAVRKP